MLSVTDLFTPVTEDEALETFLSTLQTLGVPARSWRTGGALRNILRVVANSYASFTSVMADFAKSGFLDSAEGGWLTLLAHFVYGVDRRAATFAAGQLLFTNVSGAVYDGSNAAAGTVRALWVSGGKAYFTLEDLNLNGPSTQLVNVQAVEIGSASSVGPGLLNTLETGLIGVSVTNPLSIVGSDAQDDESLRQLCRDKIAALSLLGPRGAYAYAISIAKRIDGSPVDINRTQLIPNDTTGVLAIYAASPSGTPLSTDLDLARASIEAVARPDTVSYVLSAASTVAFSKSLTIWARNGPGIVAADISAAAEAALVAMVAAYDIGGIVKPPSLQGYLYASNIEGTAKSSHPAIFAIDGVGGDLALNPGQVATLAATLTVRLV